MKNYSELDVAAIQRRMIERDTKFIDEFDNKPALTEEDVRQCAMSAAASRDVELIGKGGKYLVRIEEYVRNYTPAQKDRYVGFIREGRDRILADVEAREKKREKLKNDEESYLPNCINT